MIGGDVAVAWVDKRTLQGYAVDYFLDAKSQCSGRRGSCPDARILVHANRSASRAFQVAFSLSPCNEITSVPFI